MRETASPAPTASAESTLTPSPESLFELDAPSAEPRSVQNPVPTLAAEIPCAPRTGSRSTQEFLFELDAPAHAPREDDLDAEPAAAAAPSLAATLTLARLRAEAAREAAPPDEAAAATQTPAKAHALDALPELGWLLPAPEPPHTAQAQLEQHRRRSVVRIQTCRDAFRLLGSLGLQDTDRKTVARMLMEIDWTLERSEGQPSAVNDPRSALEAATGRQLDAIDRLLGPIEDRLILLDENVPREAFEQHVESRKHTKKVIARYGRLLASRRFQADQRRNRFEWIATHLLTTVDGPGLRKALPPDRARQVLQHLIGDLPHKIKKEELTEALQYLRDAHGRLQLFVTADEFFESGFYVDLHGYKVTMRDQLLVPEFVYLSAVVNAAIESRLEGWIRDLERLHGSSQVRREESPRAQIMRGLRAQEEAVDAAIGNARRKPSLVTARAGAPSKADTADRQAPRKKPKKKKPRSAPRFEVTWDRNLIWLIASVVLVLGAGGFLALRTGAAFGPTFEKLKAEQVREISPVLTRGSIVGSGKKRRLEASVLLGPWEELDPRRRQEEADRIAKALKSRDIMHARIKGYRNVVIQIDDGLVMQVEGGKL